MNIEKLINGAFVRLRYVFRFSTCRVQHRESVAEHSFFTAFYCVAVYHWLRSEGLAQSVDLGELLQKAICHDLEECWTGDLPRNVKHATLEMRAQVEQLGSHALWKLLDDLGCGAVHTNIHTSWESAKDDSMAGKIVAFADFLSVIGYVLEELRGANNTLKDHLAAIERYQALFMCREFEFLAPLTAQVSLLIKERILSEA